MTDYMIAELIKNEHDEFERNENNLHDDLDKNRFYDIILEQYGFSYETISRCIQGAKFEISEQQKFNIALRALKRTYGINVSDSVMYLDSDMDMALIMKFIDGETRAEMKREMGPKRNKKNKTKTSLKRFVKFKK